MCVVQKSDVDALFLNVGINLLGVISCAPQLPHEIKAKRTILLRIVDELIAHQRSNSVIIDELVGYCRIVYMCKTRGWLLPNCMCFLYLLPSTSRVRASTWPAKQENQNYCFLFFLYLIMLH